MFSGLLAESDEIFNEQDVTAELDRMKISPVTIIVIIDLLLRYGDIPRLVYNFKRHIYKICIFNVFL